MGYIYSQIIKQRLGRKLLLLILLFSGIVTLIITAAQLYIEYDRDVHLLNDQFVKIEKIFAQPLTQALWFFNEKSLKMQLQGISNLRDIEYIELLGEKHIALSVGQKISKHTVENTLQLIYEGENFKREIGRLTVVASMTNVYGRLTDRMLTLLVAQAVKTFLVSTFIFLMFHFLIIKHITSVTSYLNGLNFKTKPQTLELHRKYFSSDDELAQTVSSINGMVQKLYLSYFNIEKMVKERTVELQRVNDELAELAQKDYLTGISNRRHFIQLSSQVLKISNREKKASSLLMMDIDYFKSINDTHGHEIGDQVIKLLAHRVSNALRESDLFARFGGEEFVVLAPNTTISDALLLAEKLRHLIENIKDIENVKITVSIGVSELLGDDVIAVIKRADSAMYTAKKNGKNRVECYGMKT